MEVRKQLGYMTQAFSLYGELTRPPEPGPARAPLSPAAGQGEGAHRGAGRAIRSRRASRCAGRRPAAGLAPAAVAGGRGAARAGDADPRRADLGRRSGRARQLLGAADRSFAQAGRHDLRHDALHERRDALRPHLADARGQGAGVRRAAEADRQRAARTTWKTPSSATWRTRSPTRRRGDEQGRRRRHARAPARRAACAAAGAREAPSAAAAPRPDARLHAQRDACRSCAIRSAWRSPSSARRC